MRFFETRVFGSPSEWSDQDLITFSDEFAAPLVLAAYGEGVFPMPLYWGDFHGEIGWWSPVERGILPLENLRITRSLRKTARRYTVTVDQCFADVMARCADPSRADGWIDERIRVVYQELHDMGIAHSVETWNDDGLLVGGLYGVSLGGLFAGESMFHDPQQGRDASKTALIRLVELLDDGHQRLLDVQWCTDHLATLGVIEIDRDEYLEALEEALGQPYPDWESARAPWRLNQPVPDKGSVVTPGAESPTQQ